MAIQPATKPGSTTHRTSTLGMRHLTRPCRRFGFRTRARVSLPTRRSLAAAGLASLSSYESMLITGLSRLPTSPARRRSLDSQETLVPLAPERRSLLPSSMHRRRFLAVLVTLTLALQLALAGRGTTCVASSDGERMAMTESEPGMSGMDMSSGTDMSNGTYEAGGERSQSPAQDHETGDAPCDRSPASTTCQPFASCAAGIMVADASAVLGIEDASTTPRVIDALALLSRTIAPELPPPRL